MPQCQDTKQEVEYKDKEEEERTRGIEGEEAGEKEQRAMRAGRRREEMKKKKRAKSLKWTHQQFAASNHLNSIKANETCGRRLHSSKEVLSTFARLNGVDELSQHQWKLDVNDGSPNRRLNAEIQQQQKKGETAKIVFFLNDKQISSLL